MKIGEAVRRARHARGWTQKELANHALLSQATVARIEHGIMPVSRSKLVMVAKALGVDLDSFAAPEPAERAPMLEAHAIRTMPARLGLELAIDIDQQPEQGGDFFAFVPVASDEVLVAAVDVAGNGPSAMPAARYLQGWIRGHALASGAPRLDVLADTLRAELTFTGIEAAWYLALLKNPTATTLHYQAISSSFPAPLLLVDEFGTTLPSVDPTNPSLTPVTYVSLHPPITLALATDGLLRRLGVGDEQAGKRSLRRWLNGERGRRSISAQFGARQTSVIDESLAVIRWSPWDMRFLFDISDATSRHDVQKHIRARAAETVGARADDLGRALAEALHNILSHAYPGGAGRVEVTYRIMPGQVDVEVRDEGAGTFHEGDGMALIRKSCSARFLHDSGSGHVVYLRCSVEDKR